MRLITFVVSVAVAVLGITGHGIALERGPSVEVSNSAKIFLVGQKDAVLGSVTCTKIVNNMVEACSERKEIITLPLKIKGMKEVMNIRLMGYDAKYEPTILIGTAELDEKGSLTNLKQITPWFGKTFYIVGDIKFTNLEPGKQFLELKLTASPTFKDANGVIISATPLFDNNTRSAVANTDVNVVKIKKTIDTFDYQIKTDLRKPVSTKMSAMLWPNSLDKTNNFNMNTLNCSLNHAPIAVKEFNAVGSWDMGWIIVKNGDIITCSIDPSLQIYQYTMNLGVDSAMNYDGIQNTNGEIVKMNYQDREDLRYALMKK